MTEKSSSELLLPSYFKIILAQKPYSKKLYSYTCDTIISNHDGSNIASQITSNVTFAVVKAIENGKILVKFEILDTFINNTNSEGQKIAEMGKIFALPINKLILEVNAKGKIKEILNKVEIAEKWKDLFNNISKGMDEQYKEKIKNEGDKDYLNPIKAIKGSFLHEIFFFPIFGIELNKNSAGRFNIDNRAKLLESISNDYTLTGKITHIDNNTIIADYYDSYDDNFTLLSKARKVYGNLVPKKSNFHQEIRMLYQFDIHRSIPLNIDVHYIELIEGALKYRQISNIKLLS